MKLLKVRGIAFAFAVLPPVSLNLPDFLKQVENAHKGYQASNAFSDAAYLRQNEGDLLTAFTAFADLRWSSDAKAPIIPTLTYDKLNTSNYTLGVSKLTTFGMQAKLYYNINYFSYINPAIPGTTSFNYPSSFYIATPTLELTQSLWSNFFGRGTRASHQALESQTLATAHAARFQATATLVEAEGAYWRLALARQGVQVQKQAYERAKRIQEWNDRRARLNLADRVDALQASAALRVRTLELQMALDEERAAARAFNLVRNQDKAEVTEEIAFPSPQKIQELPSPIRKEMREDLLAAQEQSRAIEANATVALERDSPTLDLYALYALNGRSTGFGASVADPFSSRKPTEAIGVRFSVPIDLAVTFDARDSWRKEARAAELQLQRKQTEQEVSWRDLGEKLLESRKRLSLAMELENAQEAKTTHERSRLQSGRSTMFQVLLFEQDFAQAQLARIQAQGAVLSILTQMKLFSAPTSNGDVAL